MEEFYPGAKFGFSMRLRGGTAKVKVTVTQEHEGRYKAGLGVEINEAVWSFNAFLDVELEDFERDEIEERALQIMGVRA